MYITQTDINAPTFVAFINHKDRANFAFKKWLENTIRRHFKFIGTPIVIKFKDREEKKMEKLQDLEGEQQDTGGRTAKKSAIQKSKKKIASRLVKTRVRAYADKQSGYRKPTSRKTERVGRQ